MSPNKYCEWCGNTSGKANQYGGCISCGGPLTIRDEFQKWTTSYIISETHSVDEVRRYMGITGSTVGRVVPENLYPIVALYKGVPVNELPPEALPEYLEYLENLKVSIRYD